MSNDLYLIQEVLEFESRSLTLKRFEDSMTEKLEKGEETATYYGSALMKRAIEPMVVRIKVVMAEANSGKGGVRATLLRNFCLHTPI